MTPKSALASLAIEVVYSDGSRSRYEADHSMGWFVIVTDGERVRVAPHELEDELRSHMWRMAFGERR